MQRFYVKKEFYILLFEPRQKVNGLVFIYFLFLFQRLTNFICEGVVLI